MKYMSQIQNYTVTVYYQIKTMHNTTHVTRSLVFRLRAFATGTAALVFFARNFVGASDC